MDLSDIFNHPTARQATKAAGMLFVVRCAPDAFTGERFNVGVYAVASNGQRAAKVIEQVGRLDCLYGNAAGSVLWLAKAAQEAALKGTASPSPQITFDGPSPYYNCSAEQAVERAFVELVTVALPRTEGAGAAPKVTDEDALQSVGNAVRTLIGLNFELLANTPQVVLETDRGPWTVNIPLQPSQGVGIIRSADYTPAVLKTHLMDSVLDLTCAAHYRLKRGMGLFLLLSSHQDKATADAVEAVVDNVLHRAPGNLQLHQDDHAAGLAQRIQEWGSQLAA